MIPWFKTENWNAQAPHKSKMNEGKEFNEQYSILL